MSSQLKQFTQWLSTPQFLLLGILISLLLHGPFFNEPPQSAHVWRQCHTLAMAQNFHTEGMTLFHPRVSNRFETSGLVGSHFPIYEFLLAGIYKITGEEYWVHRFFSFLLYLFGAWGIYKLAFHISQLKLIAALSFWAYLFSPELFYHGINALPDILALAFGIWALYWFILWFEDSPNKSRHFILSLVFMTIAGLTKLQYLAFGLPIAGMVFLHLKKIKTIKKWGLLFSYALFSVGLTLAWYYRSLLLIEQTGLADFGLEVRPATDLGKAFSILTKNIFSFIPETLCNYASFSLLILGLYSFFTSKKWQSRWFVPCLIWAIGLAIYHILELNQMEHHGYYMMPYIPLLLLASGYGAYFLYQKGFYGLLLLLVIAQPILASVRIIPSRWMNANKGIPIELYQKESRERLQNAVPNDALCMVGIDASNSIFFYFLNKKGFGLSEIAILDANPNFIESYRKRGAEYLYLYHSDLLSKPYFKPYIDQIIHREGQFVVIDLSNQD